MPKRLIMRLVLLMTLALLPLGLISIWQTRVVVNEAEALSRAGLLARTIDEASAERRLVQNALGVAEGMASVALALDAEQCNRAMDRLIAENDTFIFAGFVARSGIMTCSTADGPIDFTQLPNFEADIARQNAFVQFEPYGPISQQPVLVISQPVRNSDGLQGQMYVSIPHAVALQAIRNTRASNDLQVASFNADGELIASSQDLSETRGFLPAGLANENLSQRSGETFRATSEDGRDRLFAVAPLVDDTLYLVGSWPASTAKEGAFYIQDNWPALFPILMWLAGMAVAVLGLQHLVLRHIRDLRSAMRQFGLGDRGKVGLKLVNPPQEFQEAERAFNRMTLILSEAEARQAADLRDKEVLLREVHHRVKNNLQLIASIMNMQMRRATTEEARGLLSGLQQRVRGLAMLHRTLYTSAEQTTIDSRDLIQTVVEDASNLVRDHQMEVETDLASFPLYPDQAVPLSMLLAEALTNAFKYSNADNSDEPIRVVLQNYDQNVARLMVTNPLQNADDVDAFDDGDGLGTQLAKAFIRQLDGVSHSAIRNDLYVFEVSFERREFESFPHA